MKSIINMFLILLLILLIFNNLYKFEKKRTIIKIKEKKSSYRKFIFFKNYFDEIFEEYFSLMKMKEEKEDYYKENIIFSLSSSILIFIFIFFIFNLEIGFIISPCIYIIGNYIYIYVMKDKMIKYKTSLSSEVIELFLTFNLLYPTYKNPDLALKKIIYYNKNSEINRQMEYMISMIEERGLEVSIREMLKSVKDVSGLDVFIELYYNLRKEGIKALQNINTYIESIISSNELIAEKKINEAKTKVELISIVFIFLGLVLMILSPMLLGRFDGKNSLIDYIGFISGK